MEILAYVSLGVLILTACGSFILDMKKYNKQEGILMYFVIDAIVSALIIAICGLFVIDMVNYHKSNKQEGIWKLWGMCC